MVEFSRVNQPGVNTVNRAIPILLATWLSLAWAPVFARAQTAPPLPPKPSTDSIRSIVPQAAQQSLTAPNAVEYRPVATDLTVKRIDVDVTIEKQTAHTRMQMEIRNGGNTPALTEIVVPVPAEAKQSTFRILDRGQKNLAAKQAQLMTLSEATRFNRRYAVNQKDTAVLEFLGVPLARTGRFSIPAASTRSVEVRFDHKLKSTGPRVDYVLPRTELMNEQTPWSVSCKIVHDQPVCTTYSPSHPITTTSPKPGETLVRTTAAAAKQPGTFRCSFLKEVGDVSGSIYTCPSSGKPDEGYFLLLAGVKQPPADAATIPREVTLCLDRSGSMQGTKIEQVRRAATEVLKSLDEREAFNVITYNGQVDRFRENPVKNTPQNQKDAVDYIDRMQPRGGTNLYDALDQSVSQKPTPGALPIVLFLTDGLPTVGNTAENDITRLVEQSNTHDRRVYTFGVGVDVNAPLLKQVAEESRAAPTFILPKENVEEKVSKTFRQLNGAVFADLKLRAAETKEPSAAKISNLLPARLPDLYRGDQLVLLGQYKGMQPQELVLSGNLLGKQREFYFTLEPHKASAEHLFVSRLWAGRKIAALVDRIRELGAYDNNFLNYLESEQNPRVKKLAEEVLALTAEHGIVTEYTAFLARPGNSLIERELLVNEAVINFENRAMKTRVGMGAVNQSVNNSNLKNLHCLNYGNCYYDASMNTVTIKNVQQLGGLAFFRQGDEWYDSRLMLSKQAKKSNAEAQREVQFGTKEYWSLAAHLTQKGQQGLMALPGNVVLLVDGQPVLIRGPQK